VWEDFPAKGRLMRELSPSEAKRRRTLFKDSTSIDVTGGMKSKVAAMLDLAQEFPGLTIRIFSGLEKDALPKALAGEIGTVIRADQMK